MLLRVRVVPRSSKNEVVGCLEDGVLKVKLTAPPIDGKANEALLPLLSGYLKVSLSKIKLRGGARSKNKLIEVLD